MTDCWREGNSCRFFPIDANLCHNPEKSCGSNQPIILRRRDAMTRLNVTLRTVGLAVVLSVALMGLMTLVGVASARSQLYTR